MRIDSRIENQQTRFYDAFDEQVRDRLARWLELHEYRVLGRMLRDLDPVVDEESLAAVELTLTWVTSVVRQSGGLEREGQNR